jgi:hypothetical protein
MRLGLAEVVYGNDTLTQYGTVPPGTLDNAGASCLYGVDASGNCNPAPNAGGATSSPVPGLTVTDVTPPAKTPAQWLSQNSTLIVAGCAILGLLLSATGGKR